MRPYLGIDLGGTKTALALVTRAGEVIAHRRIESAAARQQEGLLAACAAIGTSLARESGGVTAVGLALPGPVAGDRRRLLRAQSLSELDGIDLVAWAEATFGAPAVADNDANAAALAEARFGAGRGARIVCYFTLSTGIGGGIVADGRLFRGAHGLAGEFGHQKVHPHGPRCGCGGHGCLEAVASGTAIARRAAELAARHPESLLAEAEFRRGRPLTAALVAEAVRAGDAIAIHLWEEVGEFIGIGIANAVNLFDPECVVLGGGLTGSAELFLPALQQELAAHAMPEVLPSVRVALAALGEQAGVIGAAALCFAAE